MPQPFSIGTSPNQGKKKKKKVVIPGGGHTQPVNLDGTPFSKYTWLIVPNIPDECRVTIEMAGKTPIEILGKLHKQRSLLIKNRTQPVKPPTDPIRWSFTPTLQLISKSIRNVHKNVWLRKCFGELARRWIVGKLVKKNDEDLLTGSPPEKPITLIDFSGRCKYVFEPSTILRDIGSRLLINICGRFPAPKLPRNPYTNIELTEGQFYSLYHQLRHERATNWMLEALYSSQYNIERFKTDMYGKLRYTLIHRMSSNPNDADGKTVLLEFIEDIHDGFDRDFDFDLYTWAINNMSTSKIIVEWRTACYKYNVQEMSGANDKNPERMALMKSVERLCWKPFELIMLKAASETVYAPSAE